jgi:hypothetical protein
MGSSFFKTQATAIKNATVDHVVAHPYYPLEIEIYNYIENKMSVPLLLSLFFGGCAVIFFLALVVVKHVRPNIGVGEQLIMLWFVLCELILPRGQLKMQG